MHFLCGLELEISSVQRERKKERDIERERYLFWPEGHTGELLCVNVSTWYGSAACIWHMDA